MDKVKVLFIIVLVLSITSFSNAITVIYVDVNGPNDPGTGVFENPFRKIQDAIYAAVEGDVIEIWPGCYSGAGNYNLDPGGLALTIRSTETNDPETIANTIIDPNREGRGFYFYSGEDANCVVSGLTIRNGYAAGDSGGAIFCVNNSSPTISNCIITNNEADLYGGGICCYYYSGPKIINCTINGNLAADGGGLECDRGIAEITNCIVADNKALGLGGGIDCYDSGNAIITNCTIVGNTAGIFGGGLCNIDSEVTVENSILWANTAAGENQGPQIALVDSFFGMSVTISYSDVQGGEVAVYDPYDDLVWGGGNIDADPYLVSFDVSSDPNIWDFHLRSTDGRWDIDVQDWVTDSDTSPCIDTGKPDSDWTDEPWPNGKRINMGAYGGTNQASKSGNIADLDISGAVDFTDFSLFAGKWQFEGDCIEDLTDNGLVDLADLAIFTENWLWYKFYNIGDFDRSGTVDFVDFALLAGKWQFEGDCIEDLSGDGIVDLADLGIFAENWLWQKE